MSGPGVGFEYPRQEVSWLQRDVLLFANTVGCTVDELHFLYVCFSASQSKSIIQLTLHRSFTLTLPSSRPTLSS